MGDVGGEPLDRLDPAVQRAGHVAQRAGQMPDLILAVGQVGDLHPRADAVAHPLGAFGEPLDRPAMVRARNSDSTTMTASRMKNSLTICSRSASTAWLMSPPWVDSSSAP